MALVPSSKGKTIVTTAKAQTEVASLATNSASAATTTKASIINGQMPVVTVKPSISVVGNIITETSSGPATTQLEKEMMDWYPDVTFVRRGNTLTMVF